jgi:hypothetical protein
MGRLTRAEGTGEASLAPTGSQPPRAEREYPGLGEGRLTA